MMNSGVAKLACRERLRSSDMKGKNKGEEKGKMHYYEEEEDERMRDGAKKVKSGKASAAILEKENGRRVAINLSDDDEREDVKKLDKNAKNKDEKRMHGGVDKMKHRKVPTTTFDKGHKKKIGSSHGREKKVHSGDHGKDKRKSTPYPLNKSKDPLKEKSRKTWNTHGAEKKADSCDHFKDKRTGMHSNGKHFEKDNRKNVSSHNGEYKITGNEYSRHKGRSESHRFNNNEMQKNEMKKNTQLDLSKENRTQIMMDSKGNKRKNTPEIFSKSKKIRTEDKDEKAGSGDRWKTKKKTIEGYNKEEKVPSAHKEKRNVTFAFFKFMFNKFEEFLLLPPVVAKKLMDLANRWVNLEDSGGTFSEVRLSMVDGSLAFHQGWNNFVSDHSIKLGDFLLFEYTARSQFSVRVFGMDSCERVCSGVERQGGKKQKGCHAPDETENAAKSMNAVSGARHVAVNSKEDRNRVVSGVEHGSSIALYDKDGCLANGKHKANDIFQTWSKGTRNSALILIADDEVPLAQGNEDTEKLEKLHAASETHCVSDNTKEDPKGVAIGALCGPSVALDNREGTLAIGECKTNCISSICSTENTTRSEIIPVIDAAPLAQENENAVELTCPLHIGDTSTMKESEPEIATPATCTKIQDSDKDLRRKQEGNTVQLECTTAVDKCPNNSKMNTNGDVCSEHEAPGGSPSLENWKKATVSGRAALDGTGLIKPAKILNTEDKLVGHYSSLGLNSSEQSLQGYAGQAALDGTGLIRPEKRLKTDEDLRRKQEANTVQIESTTAVDKWSNNGKMNTNGSVCSKHEAPGGSLSLEKWKKATLSGRAALDGTGLIKPEKVLKTEDRLVGNCSLMGVNSFEQSFQGYAGRAALDGTGKRLKTDDKLVGNCSATGVKPVEHSLRGYAGSHSCVQQTPGKISKSIHIKAEMDIFVNGKGPAAQPKTKWEQFEPMGSIACRPQMNNIPVHADHAVTRLSDHLFFSQEDRKASHHVNPAALLPVKVEVLEDDHSVLKTNLQFCIPSTTQTWIELPTPLSNALRRKGRQDRNIVMLKDPMKRLWPVFYHENSLFVGFTRGWKPFVAANSLQAGDACLLLKDLDEDELVYHVRITRK
uniref:Uncharacterized protein n=1 Tax=Avena sativa TaxID=4498 RepID=A0ACD5YMU9_AVESA